MLAPYSSRQVSLSTVQYRWKTSAFSILTNLQRKQYYLVMSGHCGPAALRWGGELAVVAGRTQATHCTSVTAAEETHQYFRARCGAAGRVTSAATTDLPLLMIVLSSFLLPRLLRLTGEISLTRPRPLHSFPCSGK